VPDPRAADLIAAARLMTNSADTPYRPRAVVLLLRQALEAALDDHWRLRAPGVEACSARSQLICLPAFVSDATIAEDASFVWWALTRACHHHPYELAPTSSELSELLEAVEDLGDRLQALAEGRPPSDARPTRVSGVASWPDS
jgi:hypothetical protein